MKKAETTNDTVEKLKDLKKTIDEELRFFFAKQLKESEDIDETSHQAVKALEEFSLRGGKRIRAALVFYGFQCFSKEKPSAEVLKVSMVMELIQAFLLIHDDIVDRDSLRRGKDSMHKIFEKIGDKEFSFGEDIVEKEHFGRAMAIFVGDICFALANMILTEVESENRNKLIYEVNRVVRDTTFGQIVDLRSGYEKAFSEEVTLKVYKLKAAAYSIETPLRLGAILAGADNQRIEGIKKYSELLGIAFSVQDDLLDLFGEKKIGKPIGSDLKEGKKTLVVLKALEKGTDREIKFIKDSLGNENLSDKDIEEIKKIMVKTGAFEDCVKYSRKLIQDSKQLISKQGYHAEGEKFLLGISDYLLERKY